MLRRDGTVWSTGAYRRRHSKDHFLSVRSLQELWEMAPMQKEKETGLEGLLSGNNFFLSFVPVLKALLSFM